MARTETIDTTGYCKASLGDGGLRIFASPYKTREQAENRLTDYAPYDRMGVGLQ